MIDYIEEGFVGSAGYLWRKQQVETLAKFIRAWVGTDVSGNKTSKEWIENIDGRETMVMQIGNARHPVVLKVFPSTIIGRNYLDDEDNSFETNAYATVEDNYTTYNVEVGYTKKFTNYFTLGTAIDSSGDQCVQSFIFMGDKVSSRFTGALGTPGSLSISKSDESIALAEWKSVARYIHERLALWDEKNYISRKVADFKDLPIIDTLKDYFDISEINPGRWSMSVDDSLTKNRSEYILHFDDSENSKNNFSLKIKDMGGDKYTYYLDQHGSSINNFDNAGEYRSINSIMNVMRKMGGRNKFDEALGVQVDSTEDICKSLSVLLKNLNNKSLTNKFGEPVNTDYGYVILSQEKLTGEPLVTFSINDDRVVMAISPYEKYNDSVFVTKNNWEKELVAKYNDLTDLWRSDFKKGEIMIRKFRRSRRDELKSTNPSNNVVYPKEVFDRVIQLIGDALGDSHLKRNCIIDVRPRRDGTEKWDILFRNSNSDQTVSVIIDSTGRIIQSLVPEVLQVPQAPSVRLNTQSFANWISQVSDAFLDEFGAYNKARASVKDGEYIDPDYDLGNWSDRFLGKYEGQIVDMTNNFALDLEESSEDDDYKKGKITFVGDYKDLNGKSHDIEIRLFWSVGNKFKIWIRPDMKGAKDLKWDNQRSLSQLRAWLDGNVQKRGFEYESKCRSSKKSCKLEYDPYDSLDVVDDIRSAVVEAIEEFFETDCDVDCDGNTCIIDVDGDNSLKVDLRFSRGRWSVLISGEVVGHVNGGDWRDDPGFALENLKDQIQDWLSENYQV